MTHNGEYMASWAENKRLLSVKSQAKSFYFVLIFLS